MHYIYIIYSHKIDKFYVGETQFVKQRLKQHNQETYKGAFTKSANDWIIVKTIPFKSRNEALKAEKFIKKMKSRKFIHKLIDNHVFIYDII